MHARDRGFSLTETLVVAALLGVLIIIAAPRLAVPETLQVRVPARQLASDLRLAQRLAIARRIDYLLEFSPPAGPYLSYVVRQQGGVAEPDFPRVIPSGVIATGPQQFTFRPDGSAAPGGVVSLALSGATATVQITAATGRVVVSGP
jgi:prepilin-type N-terminal cleavage/methylation domain-containing protein